MILFAVGLFAATFNLSIDNIMRGPNLYGWAPQDVRWTPDNARVFAGYSQRSAITHCGHFGTRAMQT